MAKKRLHPFPYWHVLDVREYQQGAMLLRGAIMQIALVYWQNGCIFDAHTDIQTISTLKLRDWLRLRAPILNALESLKEPLLQSYTEEEKRKERRRQIGEAGRKALIEINLKRRNAKMLKGNKTIGDVTKGRGFFPVTGADKSNAQMIDNAQLKEFEQKQAERKEKPPGEGWLKG